MLFSVVERSEAKSSVTSSPEWNFSCYLLYLSCEVQRHNKITRIKEDGFVFFGCLRGGMRALGLIGAPESSSAAAPSINTTRSSCLITSVASKACSYGSSNVTYSCMSPVIKWEPLSNNNRDSVLITAETQQPERELEMSVQRVDKTRRRVN